jgi:hypothetical protein
VSRAGAGRDGQQRSGEATDVPTLEARTERLHAAEMDETIRLIEQLGQSIARLNQLSADVTEAWLSDRLQAAREVLLQEVHLRGGRLRIGPVPDLPDR